MIYRDDQCANCGGIRVAKSTLCADCLIALCHREEDRRLDAESRIEELEREIKHYSRQLREALNYGFEQNRRISGVCGKIREMIDDREARERERENKVKKEEEK